MNVLSQIHVEHDKVVEVRPTERLSGRLVSQAAAPLAGTAHGVEGDLRCVLHMLQHHFQRHVGEGGASIGGLTGRHQTT